MQSIRVSWKESDLNRVHAQSKADTVHKAHLCTWLCVQRYLNSLYHIRTQQKNTEGRIVRTKYNVRKSVNRKCSEDT